eukprot:6552701-Ditylum_brightwellii.AAC.1
METVMEMGTDTTIGPVITTATTGTEMAMATAIATTTAVPMMKIITSAEGTPEMEEETPAA